MKKFIALVSLSLSFGLAVALANTEDSVMTHDSSSNSPTANPSVNEDMQQQGGTAKMTGDTNAANPGSPSSNVQGDMSHAATEAAKNMQGEVSHAASEATKMMESKTSKTCTNEKGILFKQGQPGFNECLQAEKSKHPEQMGGTADMETETETSVIESNKVKPTPSPTHK